MQFTADTVRNEMHLCKQVDLQSEYKLHVDEENGPVILLFFSSSFFFFSFFYPLFKVHREGEMQSEQMSGHECELLTRFQVAQLKERPREKKKMKKKDKIKDNFAYHLILCSAGEYV